MQVVRSIVGIDVAKAELVIHFQGKTLTIENTPQAIKRWLFGPPKYVITVHYSEGKPEMFHQDTQPSLKDFPLGEEVSGKGKIISVYWNPWSHFK